MGNLSLSLSPVGIGKLRNRNSLRCYSISNSKCAKIYSGVDPKREPLARCRLRYFCGLGHPRGSNEMFWRASLLRADMPALLPARTTRALPSPPWLAHACHAIPPYRLALPQRRSLHLFKTARSKVLIGRHKALPFALYTPPPLSECPHRVNLVQPTEAEDGEGTASVIASDTTLAQLYERVQPGEMLYLIGSDNIKKGLLSAASLDSRAKATIPTDNRNYAIVKPFTTSARVNVKGMPLDSPPVWRTAGEVREVHLLLSHPHTYTRLMLDAAYRLINYGCPVEFHIRLRHEVVGSATQRLQSSPFDSMDWCLAHFPHLRPDFILKGMPEGTIYAIEPVCDGRVLAFVVMNTEVRQQYKCKDFTRRFFQVQGSVKAAIADGVPMQLPSSVNRSKLLGNLRKQKKSNSRSREKTEKK